MFKDFVEMGLGKLGETLKQLPGTNGSFTRVTEHIGQLHFNTFIPVAVWVVDLDGDGYVLIDSGYFNCNVEVGLKNAGYEEPPKALVITHCHLDHTGTAARLVRQWDTPVIASAEEAPFIDGSLSLSEAVSSGAQKAFLGLSSRWNMMTGQPVSVSQWVSEGDLVEGLRVIDVPGHTPGQIALVHEGDGAVIVGDTFGNFLNRIGRWPFPGIDTDRDEGLRSIEKLADLGFEKLLPSHGEPILKDGARRLREFLGE